MEAFSDGVIAIIITIMVLELKVPHGADLAALAPLLPVFLAYILSFIYTAIYWNNHHHMLLTVKEVNGSILWANSHLLFWLSIVPFVTSWAGDNHFASIPMACYGIVLFMAAVAFTILQRALIRSQGPDSILATALGTNVQGKISPVLYLLGILFSFANLPVIGGICYVVVAIIWLIPDRRIERTLAVKREAAKDQAAANAEDEEIATVAPSTQVKESSKKRDINETNL